MTHHVQQLWYVLAAFVLALGISGATAIAQDDPSVEPDGPVAECVEAMAAVADRATRRVQRTTRQTLGAIAELGDEGAPDRAIARAGTRGVAAVAETSADAAERVTRIARRCVRGLRENEAPQESIDAVITARDATLERLRGATDRARTAITDAVESAIGG